MNSYYVSAKGDALWHKTAAKTLTAAKAAASKMYQRSVGGKIMVGEKFGEGTEGERIDCVAVKYGYDKWQQAS